MSTAVSSAAMPHDGRLRTGRRSDRLAGHLALAGASLGALAGLLELAIGPSVRDWVGNKQDTTRLGPTTLVLSAVAALAAAALRRPRSDAGGRRVAIALALVIPALVCYTTVGRLWYLPGTLLLGGGALVLAGTRRGDFAAALDGQRWRVGLLVVCGAYYVLLGATALGLAGVLGLIGGASIWTAARIAPHSPRAAYAFLVSGALPFAAATWWSVITPVLAVLTVVIGVGVIHHADPSARTRQPQ